MLFILTCHNILWVYCVEDKNKAIKGIYVLINALDRNPNQENRTQGDTSLILHPIFLIKSCESPLKIRAEGEDMTERKLITVLTDVCESVKSTNNGFVWLTHVGHWRAPQVIAVFNTEQEKQRALTNGWDIDFINQVNIALASIKSAPVGIYFDSEEECKKVSGGNWDRHLSNVKNLH